MIRLLILVVIITIYVLIVRTYRKYLRIQTIVEHEQNKKYINVGLLFGSNNNKIDDMNNNNNKILEIIKRTKAYNISSKTDRERLLHEYEKNINYKNKYFTNMKKNIFKENSNELELSKGKGPKLVLNENGINIHTSSPEKVHLCYKDEKNNEIAKCYKFITI